MKTQKNIIFTVTHGRTGTTLLTEIFKLCKDTRAEHEPEPNYASILPKVKQNPRYAISFLEKKINSINSCNEKNYIETSNVFGKGFLIPLIRMGVWPKLILLNRDFRQTANSLFQRGSIPMRTTRGQHFSSDPSFPGSLDIFQPKTLSDYQLCFWGVLDAYSRQIRAAEIYKSKKKDDSYHWISMDELNDFDKINKLVSLLGLRFGDEEKTKEKFKNITSQHHNPNPSSKKATKIDFLQEEIEVLDRAAYYDPIFVEMVLKSIFINEKVKEFFKPDT
ncbi:hypothetical protein SAMN05421721_102287 [Ectothiorhodospira mobilis]|uniref:Sulfotransferase family protein n=1 Tax=Ectothiorhodospira mobilis TaxID=195064 RepID=A0A1I4PVJ5_ECTMO|nr:hypothetical protein [Ectothiorhodospira mobilis]SFM31808.1 hypothetical protein SAMN05421721_102287 [Ectothiorhodospira mobilis]